MRAPGLIRAAILASVLLAGPAGSAALAQAVTASVKGTVETSSGQVGSGGKIGTGDTVRTGAGSSVTLMLRDRTALTAGPNSEVKVSSTGSGTGGTSLDVARGGFRLITGVQDPSTYKIRTPQATLGVRGTIIEGFVDTTLNVEVFVLVEGAFEITTSQGRQLVSQPGTYVMVLPGGQIIGPNPWPGNFLTIDASLVQSEIIFDLFRQYGGDPLPGFQEFHDAFQGRGFTVVPKSQGPHLPPCYPYCGF